MNFITLGIDKNACNTQFTKQVFPEFKYPLQINGDSIFDNLVIVIIIINSIVRK